jgi:hypothetical protein
MQKAQQVATPSPGARQLRTIKLYHHCTIASARAISAVSVRGTLGRWFAGDMGEHFIPGAAQAAEHVNNNTITTHG